MILTDGERQRFAQYLAELADENERMIVQLKKLGQGAPTLAMADKMNLEVAAARLIERRLRRTEAG